MDESRQTTEPQLQCYDLHLAGLYGSTAKRIFYDKGKGKVVLILACGLCEIRSRGAHILDLDTRVATMSNNVLQLLFHG